MSHIHDVIINDLSKLYNEAKVKIELGESYLKTPTVSKMVSVISLAAQTEWKPLIEAFHASQWADVGFIALEDALTIATPFVPQAGAVEKVIGMTQYMIDKLPQSSGSAKPLAVADIMKGLHAIESINWKELYGVMMGDSPLMAQLVTIHDLAQLAAPFCPAVVPAAVALGVVTEISLNSHPIMPYRWPGFHWDALYGWTPDREYPGYRWNREKFIWEKV